MMMVTAVVLAGLAWQQNAAVSPEAVQHARAGLAAKEQGNLKQAIEEFKAVTQLAPGLAAAFVNLGAAYMDDRQYGMAIDPLKRSLELNPNLPGAEKMLGYALLTQGYAADAIPYLQKTGSLDALGIAQLKTNQLPEAVETLQKALRDRPNDPDLLYYLGRASGLLSKQAFDELTNRHPESARAHQATAEGYSALKRIPEAEKEYDEAIRLQSDAMGLHLALGQLYGATGQWEKAEQAFLAESRIEPGDAETMYRLGNAQLTNGKASEALKTLQRADELKPQMPETLYALGKAASLTGNNELAEKSWKSLITIEHESSLAGQAHFGLAALYRKQHKAKEAAAEMQEYTKLQPKQP
jgi:tetratricopeptide (TPR) repeat protein